MFCCKCLRNRTANGWVKHVCAGLIILFLSGCGVRLSMSKPKVVGILSGVDAFADTADGFISGMTKLGYVEGKNICYKVNKINPDPVKERAIIHKFVADQVDLIFTFPTGPALMAKKITSGSIPVIFAIGTTEDNDLIKSVRSPGGNITGIRFPGADLTVKRMELLLEIAPRTKRIWAAYQYDYPPALNALKVLRPATVAMGVKLVEVPVKSVTEIGDDLKAREKLVGIGIDAILIMPEPLAQTPDGWKLVSGFAARHRLPISGNAAFESEQGAVFTYIPDNFETGKMAASLADKIFKGIPAGQIPVVTPESRLRINYKLALKLGLKVSEDLLCEADEIIH